jgi:hypothetical protein
MAHLCAGSLLTAWSTGLAGIIARAGANMYVAGLSVRLTGRVCVFPLVCHFYSN